VQLAQYPVLCHVLKGTFHATKSHSCHDIQLRGMEKQFIQCKYLESIGPSSTYFPFTQVSHLQACNAAGINYTLSFCMPSSTATRFSPDDVVFLPVALAKQSKQGKLLEEFIIPFFSTQFRGLSHTDA